MAIDEKYVGGQFYTVLSNHQSGKIALLAASVKSTHLNELIPKLGSGCFKVRYLTRDLAQNYDWVGRTNFMNACHVADKFHILKHLFEALSDVRVYYRQQILSKMREAKQKAIIQGKSYKHPREEVLENGDTHRQLLARSRHLLFKQQSQWSQTQKQRAQVLFKHYPAIHRAYLLAIQFRKWYDPSSINKPTKKILETLNTWYEKVELSGIVEMLNFKALVERHQGVICNYFLEGHTNAKAEALNRNIKTITSKHASIRNLDYMHFRLKTLLS